MNQQTALSVKDLKTFFYTNNRCNKAVNGVSFDINKGSTLCVVGESGCGKSVTASTIMQLLPRLSRIEEGSITYHSDTGDIAIHELERDGAEMKRIRGSEIAMIFQDPMTALNPVYTIGFQIAESLQYHTDMSKSENPRSDISTGYMPFIQEFFSHGEQSKLDTVESSPEGSDSSEIIFLEMGGKHLVRRE